ncbi:MAG: protein arginine kinase, partial [Peptococcaceae bacterium]|nr:protein arginine kinase [Peptococcaceae bacterium]
AETEKSPVVLSNRIRLARNVDNIPFPHVLTEEGARQMENYLAEALQKTELEGDPLIYLPIQPMPMIDIKVLLEKHLISLDLANAKRARGVALTADHRVAVMVNEEDHLRIQVLRSGDSLSESFRQASLLDDALESRLDFCFRENQGYLTACPTNVGTGLRASVMVHLPALVIAQKVQQVLGTLTQLGLAVRGLFGEGSQALGDIFQISNQITLGKSEEDIIAHLQAVTQQIMDIELATREHLRRQALLAFEDKVWRARGLLQNARQLGHGEMMHLLSLDRLGTDMGILPETKISFTAMLVNSHPGCLQYLLDQELAPEQLGVELSKIIREAITER